MTDNEFYMTMILEEVSKNLKGKNAYEVIQAVAQRSNGLVVDQKDQYLLGGILGSMLHSAYCDSRKLPEKNADGLENNPRLKEIKEPIDENFIKMVKDGVIPTSKTLFFDENGKLFMDIANTNFINLSPYWKKDNFMAGCAAARSILTNWEGLTHESANVRKYVEIGVANAIHEAWIARGNVYYSEYNGTVYTNKELDTAYVNLSQDEKDKDLEHFVMAKNLIAEIVKEMNKTHGSGAMEN